MTACVDGAQMPLSAWAYTLRCTLFHTHTPQNSKKTFDIPNLKGKIHFPRWSSGPVETSWQDCHLYYG